MPGLPNEVLLLIGEFLYSEHDKLSLLYVCRHWKNLFLGLAYREIMVEGDRAPQFVRAIQLSPAIGYAVQKLYLHEWESSSQGVKDVIPREAWHKALGKGSEDAWWALVLTLLENLTSLAIDLPEAGLPPFFLKTMARAGSKHHPSPGLQRLQSMVLEFGYDEGCISSHNIVLLLNLPQLRYLSAVRVVDAEGSEPATQEWGHRAHRGTSPVTSLSFTDSGNAKYGMSNIITSCANLEHFEYQHILQVVWGGASIGFRPTTFYRPLWTQRHSLKTVHLNYRGEGGNRELDEEDDDDEDADGWFGSLQEFRSLSGLWMRASNLLDLTPDGRGLRSSLVLSLPGSLQSIYISDCGEIHLSHLTAAILELLAHKTEKFPLLRRIGISPSYLLLKKTKRFQQIGQDTKFKPIVYEKFELMQKGCQNAGVELCLEP
ncbi:hypothetical protein FE257_010114 [Aspergillus nanangensis]|uniref:F-box domain-containing protein n=1 Tax=Aspergillus nanangensis TaxID=2582783 RepID=A0AAD4CJF3_ASPNN|nr:hypothetical protein FE257_010114 [Aspergillus nanangensis]